MVMAMVLKEKPLQEVKYKPNMATPDFENFQQMLREADKVCGCLQRPIYICADTSEANEARRNSLLSRESELRVLKTLASQRIIRPPFLKDEVVSIRVRPPSTRSRINEFFLQGLQIPAYDRWEADIVWSDDLSSRERREDDDVDEALNDLYSYRSDDSRRWKRLALGSDETLSRKLRRVIIPGNEQLARGLWVRGIVWGDVDHGLVQETSDDEEDIYGDIVPLVHTANDSEQYLPLPYSEEPDIEAEAALAAAREAAAVAEVAISAATNAVASKPPPEVVKGPLYRQQKAREKKERLDKLKALAFSNLKGGTAPGDGVAVAAVPVPLPQEITMGATSRRRRATATAELEHCIVAARHMNCKPYLRKLELKYFHRPVLAKQARLHSWQLTVERKGTNKVSQTKGHIRQHLVSQISKAADLALVEGDFICVEYVEENPNVLMNPGMASKILNYYRMPEEEGPEITKHIQSSQATNSHSSSASSSGSVALSQEGVNGQETGTSGSGSASQTKTGEESSVAMVSSRVPRHVQQLRQASSNGRHGGVSSVDIPKLAEGITEVLEPQDAFPFLGDIEPGAPPQPALHTNLFRAPLFIQQSQSTDFLLVRVPQKRAGFNFVVRRMNSVFTAGQQEPLMIVPKPNRKKLSNLQQTFLMLHLTRFFTIQGEVDVDEIDLEKEFDSSFIRVFKSDFYRCVRKVADRIDETTWRRKDLHDIIPAEEYENQLTPEDVCLLERGASTDFRLSELGLVQQLDLSKIELALGRMNKLKEFMRKRLKVAREMATMHRGTSRGKGLQQLVDILELNHSRLKRDIEVARYIHEKASLTPWVITEAFVKAVVEKGGSGLLRLSGLGDPSGIGEGFSFLRTIKTTSKQSGVENCSVERDLRKKTKVELDATLKTFGYDRLTLKDIPRWEKVDLVRFYANLAEAENVAQDLHRYARAPKQTMQSQAYNYRDRCLAIWKNQAKALTVDWAAISARGEEEDDSDSDDDDLDLDDSDIDAIEDDMEAAQQAKSKAASQSKTGPGRRRAEESGSDMNAFFDTLNAPTTGAIAAGQFSIGGESAVAAVKFVPPERVVKRIRTVIKPDGTEVVEVRFIVSANEVRRVLREQSKKSSVQSRVSTSNGGARPLDEHLGDTFEDDTGEEHGLKLKLGRMKEKVVKHATQQEQLNRLQEIEDQREFEKYLNPEKTRANRLVNRQKEQNRRNMRLPHVLFAASLEQVWLETARRKYATPFWQPVDTKMYPTYMDIVRRPICLKDIRENIASYQYNTVEGFLSDLKLMASNAAAFNGSDSQIAKNAHRLYDEAKKSISLDRDLLGADNDTYRIQENDIRAKFNALGRPLLSNAFVPDAKMSLPENIPAPNSKHPAKKQAIKHTSSTAAVSSSPSVQSSVTLSSSVSAAAPPILASTVAVNGGSSKVSSTSNHPVPAGASSDTPSTLTEVQIEDGESSGEEEVLEEGW